MDLVFTYDARRCIEVGASFAVRVQAIARTRDNDLLIQALLVTQSIVQRFGYSEMKDSSKAKNQVSYGVPCDAPFTCW